MFLLLLKRVDTYFPGEEPLPDEYKEPIKSGIELIIEDNM